MPFQKFLLFVVVICSISSFAVRAAEDRSESPILAKNTSIVPESEITKLQQHFDPRKKLDAGEIQSLPSSALNYYPVWYCVAQSYFSGAWYYWYSPNYNYSRFRALNACTHYNGYTCFVNCEIRY